MTISAILDPRRLRLQLTRNAAAAKDARTAPDAGLRDLLDDPVAASCEALPPPSHRASHLAQALRAALLGGLALTALGGGNAPAAAETLLNVSYDPTRELYREIDAVFAKHWTAQGHEAPQIKTSHGSSGAQARAIVDELKAQVATLALASDLDRLAEAGKLPAD